jgi:hypothetical protein
VVGNTKISSYSGAGTRREVELDFAKLAVTIGLESLPAWAERELSFAVSRATVVYGEVAYPQDFKKAAIALRALTENPATAARLEPVMRSGDNGALSPFAATLNFLEALGKCQGTGLSQRDALIGKCLEVLEGLNIKRPFSDNQYGRFTPAQTFVNEVWRTSGHPFLDTEIGQMRLINEIEKLRNPPKSRKKQPPNKKNSRGGNSRSCKSAK